MRGRLARIATACALVTILLATAAATAPPASATLRRDKMLAWVNKARAAHGVRRLQMDMYVVLIARHHNYDMATKDELFHTVNLASKLGTRNMTYWGENVGAGVTAYGLFRAYMASPEHRANILDRRYDHVGISFVVRRGIMWSTMDFYG